MGKGLGARLISLLLCAGRAPRDDECETSAKEPTRDLAQPSSTPPNVDEELVGEKLCSPGVLVPVLQHLEVLKDRASAAALRATCRAGRQQFDACATRSLTFGSSGVRGGLPLTPAGLAALHGMLARGARPQELDLHVQRWALSGSGNGLCRSGAGLFDAASPRRMAREILRAFMPNTANTAAAAAAPGGSSPATGGAAAAQPPGAAAGASSSGVAAPAIVTAAAGGAITSGPCPAVRQVLSLCAGGLSRLEVTGVCGAWADQLSALASCTALRELSLYGLSYEGPSWAYEDGTGSDAAGVPLPCAVLASLPRLACLRLGGARLLPLDAVQLAPLSQLAGLTELLLDLPRIAWCRTGSLAGRRCEQRSTALASLLAPLAALRSLDLGAARLSTADLPHVSAHLPHLTCLTFGGVRLPDRLAASYGTYGALPALPLPPALRRLHFVEVQPLRELAALEAPCGLERVTGGCVAGGSAGSAAAAAAANGPRAAAGPARGGGGGGGGGVAAAAGRDGGGGLAAAAAAAGSRGGQFGGRGGGGGGGGSGGMLAIGLMDWRGLQSRVDFEEAVPALEVATNRLLVGRIGPQPPLLTAHPPQPPPAPAAAAAAAGGGGAPPAGAAAAAAGPVGVAPGPSLCLVGCLDAGPTVLGPLLLDATWLRPLRPLGLQHLQLQGFGVVLGVNPLAGLLGACPDIKTVCLARGYYALPVVWLDE